MTMDKMAMLQRIYDLYKKQDINIMAYLREMQNSESNSIEDIMISYDFQAGTYTEDYKRAPMVRHEYIKPLVKIIDELDVREGSIFEAGVGEGTTMMPLLKKLKAKFSWQGGCDISWSRMRVAKIFQTYILGGETTSCVNLVMGDMFALPLLDNSIDVVYTNHALEPNGGHEKELLEELYRVTNAYLILLEPAYELANDSARARMDKNGYIKGLYKTAKSLGYDVVHYGLYPISLNPMNPTGIMIIKKEHHDVISNSLLACPITHTSIEKVGNAYFSRESLLAYPIVNDIPCLVPSSAIVATHMLDNFDD